jgi:hypothetical protein
MGRVVWVFGALAVAGIVRAWRRDGRNSLRWCVTPAVMALVICLLTPKALVPRYSITTFMLLVVIIGWLFRDLSVRAANAMTVVVCGLSLVLVSNNESRMLQGIPALNDQRARGPEWHGQLTGGLRLLDRSWSFLSGQPCHTPVLVVTDPAQVGVLSTLNLPAYGDDLCNDVSIVQRDASKKKVSSASLERALDHHRKAFVVVPESSRDEVARAAAARGLSAKIVSEADVEHIAGLRQILNGRKVFDEAQVAIQVGD